MIVDFIIGLFTGAFCAAVVWYIVDLFPKESLNTVQEGVKAT